MQHPGVTIAPDDGAAEGLHALDHLSWLRPSERDIAQADDALDFLGRELRQHRVQRNQIAVNIRENSQSHACGPSADDRARHPITPRGVVTALAHL